MQISVNLKVHKGALPYDFSSFHVHISLPAIILKVCLIYKAEIVFCLFKD